MLFHHGVPRIVFFIVLLFLVALRLFSTDMFRWSDSRIFSVISKAETSATSGKRFTITQVRSVNTEKQLLYQHDNYNNDNGEREKSSQNAKQQTRWPQGSFWNRPSCKVWGVATTIFPPTPAIEHIASLDGWCLVVAGDRKGPETYEIPNANDQVVFLSRERQEELGEQLEFVKEIPWNHFARKNVAYLYAIANHATFIWDFDDDNILLANETLSRYTHADATTTILQVDTQNSSECGVFNPYPFFRPTEVGVWPRGYPLDKIKAAPCQLSSQYCQHEVPSGKIGIFQSLANKDPDVDAIYRLTRPLPITFHGAVEDHPVVVPPHMMSPMNAQASLFSNVAMWSLFLPTTVHGRVSDIWRSYFAQTLAKKCDMLVSFVGPHVIQDRNVHSYLADLDAEQPLYERAGGLVSYLQDWEYFHPEPTMEGALEKLYADLYERDVIEWKDVKLIQLWIAALQSVGYKFPAFNPFPNWEELKQCDVNNGKKKWSVSTEIPTTVPLTVKAEETKYRFNNVVLVGQFNFGLSTEYVTHWVKRWGEVFTHVDVRGPFSNTTLDELRQSGINAFLTVSDNGYRSPMKTTADSLRLYANNTDIVGVIMAHDDLMVNISHLVQLGFPSESIITTIGADLLSAPYFTIYENATLRMTDNATKLWSTSEYTLVLSDWMWWKRTLRSAVMACKVESAETYMDSTHGIPFYRHGLSDFLYVPTTLTEEFAAHADWMTNNLIFLEVGTPTILGRLQNELNVTVVSTNACTAYGRGKSRITFWLPTCLSKWNESEYGIYHPVKMVRSGLEKWDVVFDAIVLGKSKQFVTDVECLQAQQAASQETTTTKECVNY